MRVWKAIEYENAHLGLGLFDPGVIAQQHYHVTLSTRKQHILRIL